MEKNQEYGQFDDERILRGLVTPKEKKDLGEKLVKMFMERAKQRGKPVIVLRDRDKYEVLRTTRELFSENDFFLLVQGEPPKVQDMTPVVYHLLDTKEGLFYAKLGCC